MSKKVYITGIGLVSSLGLNVEENLNSLLKCQSGIGDIVYLETVHKGKMPAAEVKADNATLAAMLGFENVKYLSRTAILGMLAAKEAYHMAGLQKGDPFRTGILSATSVGGIDKSEDFYKGYLENPDSVENLNMVVSHDCGDSTERIADYLGIKDFLTTISTACSSSANSILHAARMIKAGLLDRAVAGGTDVLTRYTLNGFNALKILDEKWCRPFDRSRTGLNLGEGAAYLVLESEEAVLKSGKTPLAVLSGFGNANDAYHPTASSPEGLGAKRSMELALEVAGLDPMKIDYINAHGTATPNNDMSEGSAIKSVFRDYLPRFSSTKSYTGHTLAAAGAVEAVISVLSLQHQVIFPNLNFENPIEELNISPVTNLDKEHEINVILSNSFGFGGNCSSMIFSRI
ncbi:MAG: beta-ketoacyl-[acyl-carrier-protein] synthase family protein [Saprospiraceae bacterium]|nr:beta-ketoacyl-[acyl-carrier-protein] synthase family protein [Saprospiraceae bacterium]